MSEIRQPNLTMDMGLKRLLKQLFVIGADFMREFNLLANIRGKGLADLITKLAFGNILLTKLYSQLSYLILSVELHLI